MSATSAAVISGACNCGKVTVEVEEKAFPKESSLCHCLNCKASSSGLATSNLKTTLDNIKVHGAPKMYLDTETSSGVPIKRIFCGDCGSPIMSKSEAIPGVAFLKSGLFFKGFAKEGKSIPPPAVEVYFNRAESWEKPFGCKLVQ